MYIEDCIFRQPVIIQASFVKDDGTLFIILILFFQVSLLFSKCQDLYGKGIVPYLLPKRFRPYFWSSVGIV